MESKSIHTTDLPETSYRASPAKAFERYSDMVYRLAYIRTDNISDAEDVLSDVFLRLIKNVNKIKSEEHLKAWLIRVTINSSNSMLGSAFRRHRADLNEAIESLSHENDEVLPLVLVLPVKLKTVVYMFYYEGYSVEEIAAFCSIPVGTVKSRLSRARESLKSRLKGE